MVIGVFLALFTSFFQIAHKSFWFDEAFSIHLSSDWQYLLRILWTSEANMWLYYFLLHFWLYLGQSEFIGRSLSALFAVLSIPITYLIGKKLFSKKVGTLASLLMPLNVLFVFYSQEARSYSLLLLLSGLSTLFFLSLINKWKKTDAVFYVLVTALGLYTHLYMGFVILSHAAIFFITQKKKWKMILLFLLPILLALPMAIAPSFHSSQTSWMQQPGFTGLIIVGIILTGDFPPLLAVYAAIFLKLFSRKKTHEELYLWIMIVVPVAAAFIISFIYKPLYQPEYFISSLIPTVLLAAWYLTQFKKRWIKITLLSAIFALSGIRLFGWYTGNSYLHTVIDNRNEEWREATVEISSQYKPGDITIFYTYYGVLPFQLYAGDKIPVFDISSSSYSTSNLIPPQPDLNKIRSLKDIYKRVWFVINHSEDKVEKQQERKAIQKELNKNYTLVKRQEFYKISVEEYISSSP